jgi:LysR family nod box-dependent transcriptional activator
MMSAVSAVLFGGENVTRAAERMSVGQSAVSSALARLRKQLGDPLFIREWREYRLSALAESLVIPVRELVAAADECWV